MSTIFKERLLELDAANHIILNVPWVRQVHRSLSPSILINIIISTSCLQELQSGVRIFTGSECVKWFVKNMVGVTSVHAAQVSLLLHSFHYFMLLFMNLFGISLIQ